MASIFSFQEEPPRIHSPWSTPGNTTPRTQVSDGQSTMVTGYGITKLDPERHDGPCEYKLHLLLRPRRKFLSTSTTNVVPDLLHNQSIVQNDTPRSLSESSLQRVAQPPSSLTRKTRLQQLTTQLLWRLQQSSPFHSSSNADLVLPMLPEATPRLGAPDRPAKLLPGLEESQGALYEIGVADDGILVGLVDEELDESLGNLKAMASSLGCVVEVLRRVQVGNCEWIDADEISGRTRHHADKLFVAEVLVRPDSRAAPEIVLKDTTNGDHIKVDIDSTQPEVQQEDVEQMRVALVGPSSAGKSTLLGTLTTSKLDNGRGKSRLSLLKHRHEIASGVTSSVAQELLGYSNYTNTPGMVVNYSSGDVTSWTDVHNLADRLVFISDSPGLPRYSKSTFRSLISWKPRWTVFCMAANDDEGYSESLTSPSCQGESGIDGRFDLSLAYLEICLKLKLPLLIAITKMDIAVKASLRAVLSKVLSTLKNAGRKPVLLGSVSTVSSSETEIKDASRDLTVMSIAEREEVEKVLVSIREDQNNSIVPIIMTSSVTGIGFGKLHCLLNSLPVNLQSEAIFQEVSGNNGSVCFQVDEVFSIPPSRVYSAGDGHEVKHQGIVLCGHVQRGKISVGDILHIGPFTMDTSETSPPVPRSKSYSSHEIRMAAVSRSLSSTFSKAFQDDASIKSIADRSTEVAFLTVQVVSLRNLRLPVSTMSAGETGTIGIESIHSNREAPLLRKARKGMVLTKDEVRAHRSFTACFPASDFAHASSPPLILGGHAIVYVNSIRTAVKVTAVALVDADDTEPSSPDIEVFTFDNDEEVKHQRTVPSPDLEKETGREIKVSFRFGNTIECVDVGDQVLVVPTFSAVSGSVSGFQSTASMNSTTGLGGFIGYICEVHS